MVNVCFLDENMLVDVGVVVVAAALWIWDSFIFTDVVVVFRWFLVLLSFLYYVHTIDVSPLVS